MSRTLELAIEDLFPWGSSRDLLRYAILVCKGWRYEAQRLLWSHIFIKDARRAQLILDSDALKRHPTADLVMAGLTEEVYFSPEDALTDTIAAKVVDSLKGIEYLKLYRCGMSAAIFGSASLKVGNPSCWRFFPHVIEFSSCPFPLGFTSLHISTFAFWVYTTQAYSFSPISLRKVFIGTTRQVDPASSPFPWLISFTPSIRHLTISLGHFSNLDCDIIRNAISLAACHFQSLTFYDFPPPSWAPVLASCVGLSKLRLDYRRNGVEAAAVIN